MKHFKNLFLPALLILSATAFSQQTLGLNPQRTYDITPADYGLTFDTIRIPTIDGASLFGWHLYPGTKQDKSSKKAIIISSDGNGNMANAIEYAGQFLAMGFHVFMYDYRGYGKSSDFTVNPKFFIYQQFATDLNSTVDYVKKYFATMSVDLYGWGIGAGLSLGVGCNNLKVHHVIADDPYTSFDIIQKRYEQKSGQKIMMPLGFDKDLLEPLHAMENKGDQLRGILIIIGEKGNIMNPDDMAQLQAFKKKVTEVYVVPGADNPDNFNTDKDAYFKQIKSFYDKFPE